MKKNLLNIGFFIPFVFFVYHGPVSSGVYDWRTPSKNISKNLSTSILFEGSAVDMEWLQMNANALAKSSKAIPATIPKNEEHLYIIRKGTLEITAGDSSYSLPQGSILVAAPGKSFSIQNKQSNPCEFYVMKYRSSLPFDTDRAENAGSFIIKNWNEVIFKPHERGGVRSFFERPTAMLKRMEMHVTTLNAGLKSHDPHKHQAKEIIVMMEGNTEMLVGEKFFKGKEGSVYFLESNVLHGIKNEGTTPCSYFAIQFE